jgi:hypothetical protein
MSLFCVYVLRRPGSSLAMGWSPVQGVLQSMYRIKNLKKRPRSEGLQSHWEEGGKCFNLSRNAIFSAVSTYLELHSLVFVLEQTTTFPDIEVNYYLEPLNCVASGNTVLSVFLLTYNYYYFWRFYLSNQPMISMEQSASWEAASCAATQEFSHMLWNPKVHDRIHKSLHWSLSWARSIRFKSPCLSEIHFNTIHPPTSWSS